MARMHVDELEINEALVRRLLAEQFPEWADLRLSRVEPAGTVNAIFRLGDERSVRLPRRKGRRGSRQQKARLATEAGGAAAARDPRPGRAGTSEPRISVVLGRLHLGGR